MKLIKSPIFYMGNKYDLLKQLIPLFPKNIDTLYDLFGGSAVISLNVESNKTIYNELNENIYNLIQLFKNNDSKEIIDKIENNINKFNLPRLSRDVRVKHYTEEYKKEHNENYLKFRKYYNQEQDRNFIDLYTLTYFSFCNLVRFNQKNQFNMPFGNRCFLEEHKNKIIDACDILKKQNIIFKNKNAFDILQNTEFKKDDFIYLDPPYSNTTAIYNEKRAFGGWTIEEDYKLFDILENLDKQGIKWGLSNVFRNKGIENAHLIEWCKKNNWNVNHLNKNYASLGKGNAKSDEVYICNYFTNENQLTIFDNLGDSNE